jgi:putative lipoprotein
MISLRHVAAVSFVFVVQSVMMTVGGSQRAIRGEGDVLVYYCHNLSIATVRVFPKRVEVETATRKATLPETTPPSSVLYSDGVVTLSGLGEHVRFEEPGAVYFCQSMPAEIPWQEARFRGIEFRAAGDDPPWTLEVDSGVGVEFAIGQGDTRAVTKFPPAELTGTDNRMTLTAVSGARSLGVLAERRVCNLAGSTMTLAVTVTLDGKPYRGCGRPLTSPLP